MAPRLQWSVELVSEEFIVPRLEDHLIDELFYQEDEIGEFRHTAFMVECGLEEDPPDGPDVPPVPWGEMLLKQQQQQQEKEKKRIISANENVVVKGRVGNSNSNNNSNSNSNDTDNGIIKRRSNRELPTRSRSTDDIDTLAIELTSNQTTSKKSAPKRSNSTPLNLRVVDGQSSPSSPYKQFSPSSSRKAAAEGKRNGSNENRRPARRVPTKTSSDDRNRETGLESPEAGPKRSAPARGKLTKTRSGTCHEMANASARVKERLNLNEEKSDKKVASTYRKLTKTNSGSCREMANAANKYRNKNESEDEKAKKMSESLVPPPSSPSVLQRKKLIESAQKSSEKKGRPAPLIRSLVATKSGTRHGTRKTPISSEELNIGNKDEDDESEEAPRIVYKNGKRTQVRRISSISKESRLKSKSNDSENDKKKEIVVYKNGRRESIKRYSSFSDSSVSDDQFLGDIVQDSDDNSVARSEISISTHGSEIYEVDITPQKEQKSALPKSIERTLKVPVRKRSISDKQIADDTLSGRISSISTQSMDGSKKKKKKKKKKQSEFLDDDSKHTQPDSVSSIKKKKKKKEEILNDDTKDVLFSAAKQRRKKVLETKIGDIQAGCYPSPSSLKSPVRKRSSKKFTPNESQKDNGSGPSIIEIERQGQPVIYPSPSSIKSQNRKRLSIKKSSPTDSQKDNIPSPSINKIERKQVQTSKPDDFVYIDPLAAIKKKREKAKTQTSFVKPIRQHSRPDDWLGSGKSSKRTWRVKTKTSESPT